MTELWQNNQISSKVIILFYLFRQSHDMSLSLIERFCMEVDLDNTSDMLMMMIMIPMMIMMMMMTIMMMVIMILAVTQSIFMLGPPYFA